MKTTHIVDAVKKAGGVLVLDGDEITFRLPQKLSHLIAELREQKAEVIKVLRAAGGRVATFPHCPKCSSYALYRLNNMGDYQCLTCGQPKIPEEIARRTH